MSACVRICTCGSFASWSWGLNVTVIFTSLQFPVMYTSCEILRLSVMYIEYPEKCPITTCKTFESCIGVTFSTFMLMGELSRNFITSSNTIKKNLFPHLIKCFCILIHFCPSPTHTYPLSFPVSPLCFTLSFSAASPCVVWCKWVVLNVVLSLVSVNNMEREADNL